MHNVEKTQNDIVATAVAAGSLNTLVVALKEAGLVDTLKGKELYTVFAPKDKAFARITGQAKRFTSG